MPNLGGWEWVIIGLIALLLLGGSRLAGVGRSAGRAIHDLREESRPPRAGRSPSSGVASTPSNGEPGPDQDGS